MHELSRTVAQDPAGVEVAVCWRTTQPTGKCSHPWMNHGVWGNSICGKILDIRHSCRCNKQQVAMYQRIRNQLDEIRSYDAPTVATTICDMSLTHLSSAWVSALENDVFVGTCLPGRSWQRTAHQRYSSGASVWAGSPCATWSRKGWLNCIRYKRGRPGSGTYRTPDILGLYAWL